MVEENKIAKGDDLRGEIGVFIDRDGTINRAGPGEYITKWAQFEFLGGSLECFTKLAKLPVKIFVVTNQSAVHRDMLTVAGLEHIHSMMEFAIVSAGGRVDGLKYCPHTPKEKCTCRKPSTLLFTELAREHAIDLEKSYNIGDHIRDMQPGHELGMTNILVRTGHGMSMETSIASSDIRVDYVVDNLLVAAEVIESQIQKKE
jgi:D-glycero-D-manno-heptose 1,7-bisphosphate phosphatase